jgi:hypothetical protein
MGVPWSLCAPPDAVVWMGFGGDSTRAAPPGLVAQGPFKGAGMSVWGGGEQSFTRGCGSPLHFFFGLLVETWFDDGGRQIPKTNLLCKHRALESFKKSLLSFPYLVCLACMELRYW